MGKQLITWSKQVELVVVTLVGKKCFVFHIHRQQVCLYIFVSLSSVRVAILKFPKGVQSCFSVFKNSSGNSNKSRKTVNLTPSGRYTTHKFLILASSNVALLIRHSN